MTVLVTGASGFLGGRLAQMLTERGEQVRILARPGSRLEHLSRYRPEVVQGSLADGPALAAAVRGARVIYHCAACSTDWAPWQTFYETNVRGTLGLLEAAAEASSAERFVHVSTTDVYGYPRVPCSEGAPLRDVGLPYNRSKILAEEAVWRLHRERGLPVTVIRPATIYGPRGRDFVVEIAAMLRRRIMLLIDGGRVRGGFTYVDDVCAAMMAAAARSVAEGRAYNLCGATGASWREYVEALADALRLPRPRLRLPLSTACGAAVAFEAVWRLLRLRGRPPLTRHAALLLGRDQEFPVDAIKSDIQFSPQTSLSEGVASSARWLEAQSDD